MIDIFTIYDLRKKHQKEINEFLDNCKHCYENGDSAFEKRIDDYDVEGWHEATYHEWGECQICGLQIALV